MVESRKHDFTSRQQHNAMIFRMSKVGKLFPMDWKDELDFELTDAQEIVWRLQSALTRNDVLRLKSPRSQIV